nr:segment polarity protein dishevelled homolog DVL-2-like [Desmodus rotundus]
MGAATTVRKLPGQAGAGKNAARLAKRRRRATIRSEGGSELAERRNNGASVTPRKPLYSPPSPHSSNPGAQLPQPSGCAPSSPPPPGHAPRPPARDEGAVPTSGSAAEQGFSDAP